MYRRKIQLIAGSTYSISLPKEWVKKNGLCEKKELIFLEGEDGNLILTPEITHRKNLDMIKIDLDKYPVDISEVLFTAYYFGVTDIELYSKKNIDKNICAKIRKTIFNMSGTEIVFQDSKKILIKVLLDKHKININQIIYRMCLLVDSSVENIINKNFTKELLTNEDEIDRLFHLANKVISLSLIDSGILNSSEIKDVSMIPYYFLIVKKIENLGDRIYQFSRYLKKEKFEISNFREVLKFIREEIKKESLYFLGEKKNSFSKISPNKRNELEEKIKNLKDIMVREYIFGLFRLIYDIGEEISMISFYLKFIK